MRLEDGDVALPQHVDEVVQHAAAVVRRDLKEERVLEVLQHQHHTTTSARIATTKEQPAVAAAHERAHGALS